MTHDPERVLVIHDGSLAAMVACLIAPSLGEVVAWLPPSGSFLRARGASEAMQDALAVQQAEVLGLGRLIRAGSAVPASPSRESTSHPPFDAAGPQRSTVTHPPRTESAESPSGVWGTMIRSVELLLAVANAREFSCRRVVWPVVCGGSIEAMFDVTERAAHVTRLAWLDPPTTGPDSSDSSSDVVAGAIRIETPFADLTDEQMAEMAADLDAPVQAAWWTHPSGVGMAG